MGAIGGRVNSGLLFPELLFPLRTAKRALPAVLYGTRMAVSASIALYVAFFLQLDQPSWAGTTAVIVAQPVLGAALRKGMFRLIGTLAGAVAAVWLLILFPQSRVGFFLGLAVWCGLCGYAATALRNFAAYGGMIAGFTAAIVALNAIQAPEHVLTIALSRVSTITIGIIATTLVFSFTDFGGAREDLARRMLLASQAIMSGLIRAFRFEAGPIESSRAVRRALFADVAGLDAIIDEAIGESFAVRARASALQTALSGLFSAMSSWRTIESHLDERPRFATEVGAQAALSAISGDDSPSALVAEAEKDPASLRERLRRSGDALLVRPAADISERLLLDQTGKAFLGLAQTMNGIALLQAPLSAKVVAPRPVGRTFDPLVASLNGARVGLAVSAAALFWIFTQWPDGPTFIMFIVIVSLFYTKQDEQAFDAGLSMTLGCILAAIAAGVLKFLLLPSHESYAAFSLLLAAFLIPGGAVTTLPGIGATAFLYDVNIIPMLSPANHMSYDLSAFLNNGLAIVSGSIAGAALYQLIPPLPPALRARRQIAAALRDLHRLAAGRWRPSAEIWENRLYDRMIALPKIATPLQRGHLVTALGAGVAIRQLRDLADTAGERAGADRVLSLLATGDPDHVRAAAAGIVARLAPRAGDGSTVAVQRYCAAMREIEEALTSNPAFFAGRS
jgi:uncharacterized membrane protein YccC